MRQRKAAQQIQNAIRQHKRGDKVDVEKAIRPNLQRLHTTYVSRQNSTTTTPAAENNTNGNNNNYNRQQSDNEGTTQRRMMRRATVSTGSDSDLVELQKARAAASRRKSADDGASTAFMKKNNNVTWTNDTNSTTTAANNRRVGSGGKALTKAKTLRPGDFTKSLTVGGGGANMTKSKTRRSTDDLTSLLVGNKKSEAAGGTMKQFPTNGNKRIGVLTCSMSASDEIRREIMQAMAQDEKKEQQGGGFKSYEPISAQKRVTSNPSLSSLAESDEPPQDSSYTRNDSWSLYQDPRASSNNSPVSLCGIPGIRLEDLVPTRNMSTSPSENSSTEKRTHLDNNSGNSRGRSGGGGVGEDGVINQWKSKTLMMFPPQIDFEMGNSTKAFINNTTTTGGGPSTPPPQSSNSGVHEKLLGRGKDANIDSPSTEEYEYTDDKDCPRKKFVSLYSAESKSGGTGNTSRGSMFSSMGSSLNEGNANPTMVPSIAAIEEEDKPRLPPNNNHNKGGVEGDEHSLQSTSSRFSLKSLRSRASRRTRHLAHIRKSIRNSLTGKSGGIPLVIGDDGNISDAVSDHSEHVDPDKIRRHFLERRESASSITSAYSNITTTDNTTTSKDERTPPGWRFRLRKGGLRNQSMSALSLGRNNGPRRKSSLLDDESSSDGGASFTDFYDNELHSGLMKSLLTKSTSAKSLGLALPTVDEGEYSDRQLNEVKEKKKKKKGEVTQDSDGIIPKGNNLDTSVRSDDTAESFYRHPAHEHPLLHVRPNQLFPQSPGWRCDLCMTDTLDLNEWAYVSTGLNYLLCERCFCQNGVAIAK